MSAPAAEMPGAGGLSPDGEGWLNGPRVRRWAGMFLGVHLLCFALIFAGSHGWLVKLHGSGTTDFVSFYAAGKLAGGPTPALAYDRAAHYAAERAATDPGIPYVYFFYPPVFLIYCRLLAWLPYLAAFVMFQTLTLALYLSAMRAVLRRMRHWLLPVLGFAPLLWNIGFGQNALLTAGLFAAGCTLLRGGRSLAGGAVLGLLIYKPHTGLLLPVALLAARDGKALAGAAASAAGAIGLSVLLFGVDAWPAFLHAIARARLEFAGGVVTPFAAMVNLAAALRDHGVSAGSALVAQLCLQVVLVGVVAYAWWPTRGAPRQSGGRYAVLAAAAVPMMPVVLFYDLMLLTVAAAFIVADARREGFLRWEKSGLALAWLAGGLCYPVDRAWHVPLGLLCCIILLALSLRRCVHERTLHECDRQGRLGLWLGRRGAAQLSMH